MKINSPIENSAIKGSAVPDRLLQSALRAERRRRNGSFQVRQAARDCLKYFLILLLAAGELRAGAIDDGDAAFARGDYPAAVRAFETALAAQGPSAGLYYNLAMAQSRAGERPAAAANFRRVIMLEPSNADARMALSEIERSQGAPAVPPRWTDVVAERVPIPALVVVGAIAAWCGAFLLLFGIFRRRKLSLAAAVLLLLSGSVLLAAGMLSDPRVAWRRGAVAKEGVSLLAAPADQSAVVTKLPAGAFLHIERRSGSWTYCRSDAGETGWTSSKALEPLVPSA